jgi:hypothetical protein
MLVYCLYDDDSFIGGLSLYYRTYIQCVSSWVGIDYYNFQIKCTFEDFLLAVHEPKKGESVEASSLQPANEDGCYSKIDQAKFFYVQPQRG